MYYSSNCLFDKVTHSNGVSSSLRIITNLKQQQQQQKHKYSNLSIKATIQDHFSLFYNGLLKIILKVSWKRFEIKKINELADRQTQD